MVYIDRNGRVCESRPWDLYRIIGLFTGLWFIIINFFKTLLDPFLNNDQPRGTRRGGNGFYGGGGGGGGGSNGGGGPGLRSNRHIGRITNQMDCNIPGGG